MNYTMEELIPIAGELVEKYTAFESTSVTYEKAEQLMGAVLYCIHEAELSAGSVWANAGGDGAGDEQANAGGDGAGDEQANAGGDGAEDEQANVGEDAADSARVYAGGDMTGGAVCVSAKGLTARQAYEAGAALVEKKVRKALAMYNEMMPGFSDYGNICLYDTVVKGLPEFFKWYDIKFNPQDTILTLDYPVTGNLSEYTGIDRIYEYLKRIRMEQDFLHTYPENYVRSVLREYCGEYEEMVENIYEIFVGHHVDF